MRRQEVTVNFSLNFSRSHKLSIFHVKKLEKMRDMLLPKLMSGEVRMQYDKEIFV